MFNVDWANKNNSLIVSNNYNGENMHSTDLGSALSGLGIRYRPLVTICAMPPRRSPRRAGGKAKMLTQAELQELLFFVERERDFPETDIVKILLSFMAGLRACEIAGLRISDVTNADGSIADVIRIRPNATKGGRGRVVPMNPALKDAIVAFRARYPQSEWLAVSQVKSKVRRQNANSVTQFFWRIFRECGFEGCSSHSGRRTFITHVGRNLPPGASLRDVQVIAGHRRLETTQEYIECSADHHAVTNVMEAYLEHEDA